MAEPTPGEKRTSRSFGVVDSLINGLFDLFDKDSDAQTKARLAAIESKGIINGSTVAWHGHEWTVTRVWITLDGCIDLRRVISGDSVAREYDVDPRHVTKVR